jgi:hypothetical protein
MRLSETQCHNFAALDNPQVKLSIEFVQLFRRRGADESQRVAAE